MFIEVLTNGLSCSAQQLIRFRLTARQAVHLRLQSLVLEAQ